MKTKNFSLLVFLSIVFFAFQTANAQMTVSSGTYVTVGSTITLSVGDLINNGTFTINSDASNNGSLIVSGTSTGNITYNRWMTGITGGVDKWHLISSPVGGQAINASFMTTNSIATSSDKYGLAPYNNITPGWAFYTTSNIGSAGNFVAGQGYETLRTSDGTVAFAGTVATSDVSIAITKSTSGWNLVGNPFPSAINGNNPADATNNFLTVNNSALDGSYLALYVWDAASGQYTIINNSLGATYIAPGQGFFVYSATGGGTVNFTTAMRTHQTGDIFKSTQASYPSIKLIASQSKDSTSTYIKYFSGTTTGLDPGYDAGRFSGGDNSFAVYTHLVGDTTNHVDFGIQCLPADQYNNLIPVGLNAPANTQVVFKADLTNFPSGIPVYLEDIATNTYTDLSTPGSSYSVRLATASQGIGRFYLVTQKTNGVNELGNTTNLEIIPQPQFNRIHIAGQVGADSHVQVYDISGHELLSQKLNQGSVNDVNMGSIISGIYIISVNSSNMTKNKKIPWIKN